MPFFVSIPGSKVDRYPPVTYYNPTRRVEGITVYYCYILRCSDGTFYTGVTTDLRRRLDEHNAGKGARYTSARRPVKLVWKEEHPGRSSAQHREARIKRMSRMEKNALIRSGGRGRVAARARRIQQAAPGKGSGQSRRKE